MDTKNTSVKILPPKRCYNMRLNKMAMFAKTGEENLDQSRSRLDIYNSCQNFIKKLQCRIESGEIISGNEQTDFERAMEFVGEYDMQLNKNQKDFETLRNEMAATIVAINQNDLSSKELKKLNQRLRGIRSEIKEIMLSEEKWKGEKENYGEHKRRQ